MHCFLLRELMTEHFSGGVTKLYLLEGQESVDFTSSYFKIHPYVFRGTLHLLCLYLNIHTNIIFDKVRIIYFTFFNVVRLSESIQDLSNALRAISGVPFSKD